MCVVGIAKRDCEKITKRVYAHRTRFLCAWFELQKQTVHTGVVSRVCGENNKKRQCTPHPFLGYDYDTAWKVFAQYILAGIHVRA